MVEPLENTKTDTESILEEEDVKILQKPKRKMTEKQLETVKQNLAKGRAIKKEIQQKQLEERLKLEEEAKKKKEELIVQKFEKIKKKNEKKEKELKQILEVEEEEEEEEEYKPAVFSKKVIQKPKGSPARQALPKLERSQPIIYKPFLNFV